MLLVTYRHPESTAPAAAYLCVQWTEDPLVPVSEPDLGQNIDLEFQFSHSSCLTGAVCFSAPAASDWTPSVE